MPSVSNRPGARAPRAGLVAALAIAALLALWLLQESPRLLRDLLVLLGIAMLAFFAGRAAWWWWKSRSAALSRPGLLAAFSSAGVAWLAVALVKWLSRVPSDNFIWIIMWPFMMLIGLGAGLAALAGAGLGVAVACAAPSGPRRGLLIAGGISAALLCLGPVYRLVRLLATG